jgi:hypothetical protein
MLPVKKMLYYGIGQYLYVPACAFRDTRKNLPELVFCGFPNGGFTKVFCNKIPSEGALERISIGFTM